MNLSQKVAVNTTLLILSRLVGAASGLAGVVVATRYLGPEDFGQLTVALVFVSVFAFFTDAGLYTVAARELAKRPDEEHRILANVLSMGLVIAAFVLMLAMLVMLLAYGGSDSALVRLGIVIMAVQLVASPVGGTAYAYLVAHQRAGPTALALTLSSVLFVAGLFLVIEVDLGFAGLAACYAVSGLIALVLPVAAVRGMRLGLARDRAVWRQMVRWTLPQAGVLVLGVLYFRIDTFLLAFLASDTEVALYGVAFKVLEVLAVLPFFLMSTLFPEIARQRPHSARLNELVQSAFSSVVMAAVPLVLVFACFAEQIVAIAGGPRYADSAPVLQVLVVAVALLFVNTVFFQSLVALNRQGTLFVMLLGLLVGNVALNLVLIPHLGAMGAAIALVVTEGTAIVVVSPIFSGVGTVPTLRRPLRLIAAAAGTAAVALALREVLPPARPDEDVGASFTAALGPLVALAGASVLTVALWAGALMLLRAVPTELRVAMRALRPSSPGTPVDVPPPVGG